MIKLINKDENNYEFLIYNLETEYINGFRRILYSNLKSHRIDSNSTVFIDNNTCINNEIISHRLSLIPINTSEKINFHLCKENKTNEVMNVYSQDLKSENKDYEIIEDILLHKLKPGEKLEIKTSTKEGSGKDYTSYRPFSVCHFKIMKFIYIKENIEFPHNKIDFELYDLDLDVFQKINGYKLIGYTNEIRDYSDPLKKLLDKDDYLIKEIEYNNIHVYYFTIELYFDDKNIINKTIQLLKNDLNNFLNLEMESLSEKKNIKIKIQKGKYHVLNILSKYLRNYKKLYSVYNKEHPLRDEIILEYQLNNDNKDYKNYLSNIVNEINTNLSKITFS